MEDSDFFLLFLGVVSGFLLAMCMCAYLYEVNEKPLVEHYNKVKSECELNIPRDQHCKIISIVARKKGEE